MKEEKKLIKLDDLKKENVFKTPAGYFEKLPDRVMSAVAEKKTKPKSRIYHLGSRITYYAAACLVGLLVGWFAMNNPEDDTPEALLSQATTTEMIDYLETSDVSAFETILTDEDQEEILDEQLDDFEMEEDYNLELIYLEEYL